MCSVLERERGGGGGVYMDAIIKKFSFWTLGYCFIYTVGSLLFVPFSILILCPLSVVLNVGRVSGWSLLANILDQI